MAEVPTEAEWYETAFGELYPLIYEHRDDGSAAGEIRSLVSALGIGPEGLEAGGLGAAGPGPAGPGPAGLSVLDVCCGAGRHAAALARMGFNVRGVDLSPELVRRASDRPELEGLVVRADIRALPFQADFDLVLNLFTSFGYFDSDAENARALAEMARVAAPGGWLVVDHMNRARVERDLVPSDSRTRLGARLHSERRIEGDRIRKEIRVDFDDGRSVRLAEDVRLYRPEEMSSLLEGAGLGEVRLFGGFAGEELTEDSARMIAAARKPGGGS